MTSDNITSDDVRILSDSITFYKNKDIDHALACIKRISSKFDENKSGIDNTKSRSRLEEFKCQILVMANKFRNVLENADNTEAANSKLLYNYAVLLHFMQLNQHCSRILERIMEVASTLDSYTLTHVKLLRADNCLSNQLYDDVQKFIDAEFDKDGNNASMPDADKQVYLQMALTSQIMMRRMPTAAETLDRLVKLEAPSVRFYEAHLHYASGNQRESVAFLANRIADSDRDSLCCLYNALSCAHFQLSKFNMAVMYCSRALNILDVSGASKRPAAGNSVSSAGKSSTTSSASAAVNPCKTSTFGRPYEMIHNLGIQLLFADKPVDAFDLLLEVVNVYPKNPRLWLRLAECCIKVYKNDEDSSEPKLHCVQSVMGSGLFKKVILGNETKEYKRPLEEVAAMPTPTLEFASLCIRNALSLLPAKPESADSSPASMETLLNWYKNQSMSVRPGGCIRGLHLLQLESSIFLSGAYIALCLDSPIEAVRFCEMLLRQPLLSPRQRFLGHQYAAEALVSLDNSWVLVDQHLDPSLVKSISDEVELNLENVSSNYQDWDKELFVKTAPSSDIPQTVAEAQSVVFYNQAVTQSLRRHTNLVEQSLAEALRLNPELAQTRYYLGLRVHLELARGRTRNCLAMLSELCGHFPMAHNIEA